MELEGPFSCICSDHLLFLSTTKMNKALSVRSLEFRERNKSINTWLGEDNVISRSSKEDMGIQEGVMVNFINQTLGRPSPDTCSNTYYSVSIFR